MGLEDPGHPALLVNLVVRETRSIPPGQKLQCHQNFLEDLDFLLVLVIRWVRAVQVDRADQENRYFPTALKTR